MAGISYNTHTFCSNCVEHFSKKDYPDIIWCPNKCKTRVRYNAKSVLSKRKKHRFTRINSSSNPQQGTDPHDYIIKKPQRLMENLEEIDSSKIQNLIRLTIVKSALDTLENELHKFEGINELGRSISKIGDNIKLINENIDIQGIIQEVIDCQKQLSKFDTKSVN